MAFARNNQPAYDFLAGSPSSPPQPPQAFRETLRQSTTVRPDHSNEDLRAQINKLQYELDSLKRERDVTNLQHQSEIREAQNKIEAEYRRAQEAERNSKSSWTKYETLLRESQDTQTRSANEKTDLERKVRSLQDQNRLLQEETEETKAEISLLERQTKHKYTELETRFKALQGSYDQLRADFETKISLLQSAQQSIAQEESRIEDLEAENIRLKAQTGDVDTLAVIKRELSEQVAHIKKLEAHNREQAAELKQHRKQHKSIEVVEEEKRALESKLRVMNDLRRELSEAQLKQQILEDEKKSWTAYLESQVSQGGEFQFESPEDMARAFVQERLERASLLDKLGAIQPELVVKDDNIKTLEDEKTKLLSELDKLRSSGGGLDSKVRMRLERQRGLAVKEVEYLRAQLKAFDSEESELHPEKFDESKAKRIQELEDTVDEYRKELEQAHADLSAVEGAANQQGQEPTTGSKRRRDSNDDERFGELRRKNRQLQDELSKQQTRVAMLETELKAQASQLSSLKSSSRTRILELRSNPTANFEALKLSTINTLREENRALIAQLEGRNLSSSVPRASLEACRTETAEAKCTVKELEKRMSRLRQVFTAKSGEFRQAVLSILGWKFDFLPNGRVRVTSMFYPSDEDVERSIIFDGEKGTMKVSGGDQSVFAQEISGYIDEYVEKRKDIPCFLAALTLEFWERSNEGHTIVS